MANAVTLTLQQALDKVAQLEARLKAKLRAISMKIGEKGGLSVYGLGRFPVTLYKEQWLRLLDEAEAIRMFISAHEAELKGKDD